jgi:hypothetical protein
MLADADVRKVSLVLLTKLLWRRCAALLYDCMSVAACLAKSAALGFVSDA